MHYFQVNRTFHYRLSGKLPITIALRLLASRANADTMAAQWLPTSGATGEIIDVHSVRRPQEVADWNRDARGRPVRGGIVYCHDVEEIVAARQVLRGCREADRHGYKSARRP